MTEFELIYRYFKQQNQAVDGSIAKGLGDDAAVVNIDSNSKWVTCVDTLVQGRHFSDDWQQVEALAFAIGYKSVAVNVSDVAAMGAKPHSLLLALALPQRLAHEAWLSEFAKGLFHACNQFGVHLIGGDTTRHDKLVLSVTANGMMKASVPTIYRSGAKVGDKVYVSGSLGDACYALYHSETEIGRQLAHRLHMPTPRTHLGQALAEQAQATAMIDISDGLAQDLSHICKQSGVAIHLELSQLPASDPLQRIDLAQRLMCQLTGGDDYELAFTLPVGAVPPEGYTAVTCIGEVIEQQAGQSLIQLSYNHHPINELQPYPFTDYPNLSGYQHFKE